jgi:hypothetical protein
MKTLSKTNTASIALGALIFMFGFASYGQQDDDVQTLLKKDGKVDFLWSPGIKFNSIQGDIGSAIEFYGGPVFNKSLLLGGIGAVNFGHPRVNYGYFGFIGQYVHKPNNLFHIGGQLITAYGTTKDYEREKSSLFDNFWNITGADFFVVEPGAQFELNLNTRLRLTSTLSYRLVTGLDPESAHLSRTHVTNGEMSGVNLRIGLTFGKRKRQ